MPMPSALHDVLKEKLADVKFSVDGEDKPVVDIILGYYDKYEAADKIQKANHDLTEERKAWKEKEKEYKASLTSKDEEIKRHQKNLLTDEDKTKFEEFKSMGISAEKQQEYEAKLNTATEKMNTMADTMEQLKTTIENERTAKLQATKDSITQSLDSDIKQALANVGINKSANVALAAIKAEGMAKIVENEGNFVKQYYIVKDGKPFTGTAEDVAKHFAEQYQNLVDSSGKSGSGTEYKPGGFQQAPKDFKTTDQMQNYFENMTEIGE